jgi:hypothetical protein
MSDLTRSRAGTDALLAAVLGPKPELLTGLTDVHLAARAAVDADILDVCEARIAALLGMDAVEQSGQHTAAQHACLAFTDQFVIDVSAMTDELVAAVADELGADGLVNFVNALLVVEQRLRAQLMFGRLVPELAS